MSDAYDINKTVAVQNFPVSNSHNHSYQYLQLRVLSNHGNTDYTCLYRFQVHGEVDVGRDEAVANLD